VSTADLTAEFEALERRRLVRRAVAALPVVDRRVVRLRFGLDGISFSLGEVGWLLRVSAERVRQIEARALRRLRRAASTNRIAACAAVEEG
jgi:RNA polymerase sigma factor (sigma-70 family)